MHGPHLLGQAYLRQWQYRTATGISNCVRECSPKLLEIKQDYYMCIIKETRADLAKLPDCLIEETEGGIPAGRSHAITWQKQVSSFFLCQDVVYFLF